MTDFSAKRRQQFMTLAYRESARSLIADWNKELLVNLSWSEADLGKEGRSTATARLAENCFEELVLSYSAGEPIDPLRRQLGSLIEAYERYQRALGVFENAPEIAPLGLDRLDDFERCMQLIGLCYLLHRRDLLPRIAKLEDPGYAGEDTLYEDLLSHELEGRYEVDAWYHDEPYRDLVNSLLS